MPCDFEVLTSFRGVDPKCANLTMGVTCGSKWTSVDIHVHRVTNRRGYFDARSAEDAELVAPRSRTFGTLYHSMRGNQDTVPEVAA